jgi:hypothetical protein
MKIYNEDLTQELKEEELDLNKGHLVETQKTIFKEEVQAVEEVGHYEVIAEYQNGGKDVEWVIDTPKVEYSPAHEETETVNIYVPYTDDELKELGLYEYSAEELAEIEKQKQEEEKQEQIKYYQNLLAESDYHTLKYIEGYYTDEEYESWKNLRESYRVQIRILRGETEEKSTEEIE